MQVFISWSGPESLAIARVLADWLPNVLQSTKPWFSPEHLQKGVRWAEELFSVLEASKVGIFCITPTNVTSPWVSFEAAACSTKIGGRVFTLLHRISAVEVTGPLAIFNHTVTQREDMLRLLNAINGQLDSPLQDAQLLKAFDRWWPDLEQALSGVVPEVCTLEAAPTRRVDDMAAETLDLTRHVLNNVERLTTLASNAEASASQSNPNQTRDLELEIAGIVERNRPIRYPPSPQDVALQLVDLLRHMFERDWFDKGDPPPAEGVAIGRIGQFIFRLKFWHQEEGTLGTTQRFFVQLEGEPGVTWTGSTNVATRG